MMAHRPTAIKLLGAGTARSNLTQDLLLRASKPSEMELSRGLEKP